MVDTLDYQLLSKEEDEFSNLRCDCDNTVRSRQNGHHESHWQVKTSMVWVVGSCFVLAVITALAATMSLWYRNPRDMLNYCETHNIFDCISMDHG